MSRTAVVNNKGIQETANLTQKLVELNKTTAKQTRYIIVLTWVIAGLTLAMAVLAGIQIIIQMSG